MEAAMKKAMLAMKRAMAAGGPKAVFASARSGEIQRRKAGKIKTAKLPTSLDELVELLREEDRKEITDP
jgi:hypothetical protein